MTGADGFLAAVGGGGAGREGPGRPLSFFPSASSHFVRVEGIGLLAVRERGGVYERVDISLYIYVIAMCTRFSERD